MKTNKEILDQFGQILIEEVYDFNSRILKINLNKNLKSGQLDKKINILSQNLFEDIMFSFLNIFEENEQFKIIYEENGKQINLVEISEMLKAEPIIENGWIERFSKELNKEDLS